MQRAYLARETLYLLKSLKIVFLFIINQVPLDLIGKHFLKEYPNYGNVLVWVSIILGQPLAILCYFHDYYVSVGQVCIRICYYGTLINKMK